MSAYVVPRTHIAALVRAAYRGPRTDRDVRPDHAWRRPSWFARDPRTLLNPDGTIAGDSAGYFAALADIRREIDHESIPRVAQMLLDANVASVAHRYPDDKLDELPGSRPAYWTEPADWQRVESNAPDLTPAAVLKALDGYEYQACERPDWPDSEAYAFCDALRRDICGTLPGYEEAAWCIDEIPERVR